MRAPENLPGGEDPSSPAGGAQISEGEHALAEQRLATLRQLAEETTAALARFSQAALDREKRVAELEREVDALLEAAGERPRYPVAPKPGPALSPPGAASLPSEMAEAVRARDLAEALNRELREEIAERARLVRSSELWLAGQNEAFRKSLDGAPLEESLAVLGRGALAHLMDETARFEFSIAGAAAKEQPRPRPAAGGDRWSFPIETAAGKVVGTVAFTFASPRPSTARDEEFAAILTRTAAIIIAHAQAAQERAGAERARQESERKYRTLFDSIDEGLAIVEMIRDGSGVLADARFVDANAVFERLAGRSGPPGRPIGESDLGAETTWLAGLREVARSGEPQRYEYFDRDRERWFRVYVSRVGGEEGVQAGIVLEEISERKHRELERARGEEALRHSEERLRTLADSVPQLIWRNSSEGVADYFNRRWYEYTGLSFERSYGLGWEACVHPQDELGSKREWAASLEAGEVFDCEYRLRGAEGQYRWFIGRNVPMKDAEGRVTGWFGSATDIHDLKLAQAELQEADRRKNQFLAMLGHELRNPLAATRHGVGLLRSAKARPESREAALPVVADQVRHMERLVDDLLDLTRVVQGSVQVHREPMALQEALHQALETVTLQAESSGFVFDLQIPDEPLAILGDRVRLIQVFMNVLGNAVKYSELSRRIEVSAAREAGDAVVRVRDHGRGISAELLPRVFEPFVQAAPGLTLQSGLGLGLAVVRQLVRLHDGDVEIFSQGERKGSEVLLRLPLSSFTP